jgi:hypothetical protein
MPARNAAKTLEATVSGIPRGWVDEIILVDDSSTDETVDLARMLPLHVVWHPHMPWWKRAANRGLTTAENRLMGTDLSELHTGYRAFSRKLLLEVPWLRKSLWSTAAPASG